MSKRVIIDTDAGVDDAYALIILLEAKDIDIVAITCVNGNTEVENVYNNVQRVLKLCNRTDIPVYLGASESLLGLNDDNKNHYHGKDGFGGLEYEKDEITVKSDKYVTIDFKSKVRQKVQNQQNAVEAINKIVCENPGEITLIFLGPLTNAALATKVYPNFAENIKDFYIMGGNYKGIGNINSAAEFNFYVDPEAAFIVLHSFKCPITIFPWEPCLESPITIEWRYNVLGKLSHPAIKLLDTVEKNIYSDSKKTWSPCDAYLTSLFLHPELIKNSFESFVSCEMQGIQTRGQMVIKHVEKDLKPNATIVTEVDYDLFKSILIRTFNK